MISPVRRFHLHSGGRPLHNGTYRSRSSSGSTLVPSLPLRLFTGLTSAMSRNTSFLMLPSMFLAACMSTALLPALLFAM